MVSIEDKINNFILSNPMYASQNKASVISVMSERGILTPAELAEIKKKNIFGFNSQSTNAMTSVGLTIEHSNQQPIKPVFKPQVTPLTQEQAEDFAVDNISALYSNIDEASFKEDGFTLEGSLIAEKQGIEFLKKAKSKEGLTFKEYYKDLQDSLKQMLTKAGYKNTKGELSGRLDSMNVEQIKQAQNGLLKLGKNFFGLFDSETQISKTLTKTFGNREIGYKTTTNKSYQVNKPVYSDNDYDRKMTFKEVYLLERGVEFDEKKIQEFREVAPEEYNLSKNPSDMVHNLETMRKYPKSYLEAFGQPNNYVYSQVAEKYNGNISNAYDVDVVSLNDKYQVDKNGTNYVIPNRDITQKKQIVTLSDDQLRSMASDMFLNMLRTASETLHNYHDNIGYVSGDAAWQGLKAIANLATLGHVETIWKEMDKIDGLLNQAIRLKNSNNPKEFDKIYKEITSLNFDPKAMQRYSEAVQKGLSTESEEYKEAQKSAFGHDYSQETTKSVQGQQTKGSIMDIVMMLVGSEALSGTKLMKGFAEASIKALGKTAGSVVVGGTNMAGYRTIVESGNLASKEGFSLINGGSNITGQDFLQSGKKVVEDFGIGGFGGLLNTTVVSKITNAISKGSTVSISKSFVNLAKSGEVSADNIMKTFLTVAPKASADIAGFATEVTGFTVYSTAEKIAKGIVSGDSPLGKKPSFEDVCAYIDKNFKEQVYGLGEIKGIAKLVMMMKGGRIAASALNGMTDNLKDYKVKQVKDGYEITSPKGEVIKTDSPEKVIASLSTLMMSEGKEISGVRTKILDNKSTNIEPAKQESVDSKPINIEEVKQKLTEAKGINNYGKLTNLFTPDEVEKLLPLVKGENIEALDKLINAKVKSFGMEIARFDFKDLEKLLPLVNGDNKEILNKLVDAKKKDKAGKETPSYDIDQIAKLLPLAKSDNKELFNKLVEARDVNYYGVENQRFSADVIKELLPLVKNENKEYFNKLVDAKRINNSGETEPMFTPRGIKKLLPQINKANEGFLNELIESKDLSDNKNTSRFYSEDIREIFTAVNDENRVVFDKLKNLKVREGYGPDLIDPDDIINIMKLSNHVDKNEVVKLIDEQDNGVSKYSSAELTVILENKIINNNPEIKEFTKRADVLTSDQSLKDKYNKDLSKMLKNVSDTKKLKQFFGQMNKLNNNAFKTLLEQDYMTNIHDKNADKFIINNKLVDLYNKVNPNLVEPLLECVREIQKYEMTDEMIMNHFSVLENIPKGVMESFTNSDNLIEVVGNMSRGSSGIIDLYNIAGHELFNKIPENIRATISKTEYVKGIDKKHVESTLDFENSKEYSNFENTVKSKLMNYKNLNLTAAEISSKIQAFLYTHDVGDKNAFIKYFENLDFNQLENIAPSIKDFSINDYMDFASYHQSKNTEFSKESLTYQGNLTHATQKELIDYTQLNHLLTRFPNTDKRIGNVPKDIIDMIPKEKQKEFAVKLYDIFSSFTSSANDAADVANLSNSLSSILDEKIKVEKKGNGMFGIGYQIELQNGKSYILKAFMKDNLKDIQQMHGQSIEPQNAMFAKSRTNKFARFYMGKVSDVYQNDGFMLVEYLENSGKSHKDSSYSKDMISSNDYIPSDGHNFIDGKIIDYGAMVKAEPELAKDRELAQIVRYISNNLVKNKTTGLYDFNETRLNNLKTILPKVKNKLKIAKAISIVEANLDNSADIKVHQELQKMKKDSFIEYVKTNKPNIENSEAYYTAYEINETITSAEKMINNAFQDTNLSEGVAYSSRAKSVQSIYDKIHSNMSKGASLEDASKKVMDGYGTRTVLEDFDYKKYPEIVELYKTDKNAAYRLAAKKQSEEKIDALKAIIDKQTANGDFELQILSNYKSKEGVPYFSDKQIKDLEVYAKSKGVPLDIKFDNESNSYENVKQSGYTAFQMNLKYRNGNVIEWQMRGSEIDKLAEIEHIIYDSRQKKDLTGGHEELKDLYSPYNKLLQGLNDADMNKYMEYWTEYYKAARLKELGFEAKCPTLPEEFDSKLSVESLISLHEQKEQMLKK